MVDPDRSDARPRSGVDLAGSQGGGRYQLQEVLGEGAFGRVIKARDQELDRLVAIKVLTRAATSSGDVERFLREARLTSAIDHPHIVRVYDYGLDRGNLPFLVYEFVAGEDLDRRVRRPHDHQDLVRWGAEISDALQAVHDAGALHRDVKPANVLVTADGRALLADFGLARLELDPDPLTRTGAVVGTPAYLAPEIWGGELASAASDQWGWAASLFALLYDQGPYGTAEVHQLARAAGQGGNFDVPKEHRGRFPRLEAVLRRALRTMPEARFPNMAALGEALTECLDEQPRAASPAAPCRQPLAEADTLVDAPVQATPRPPSGKHSTARLRSSGTAPRPPGSGRSRALGVVGMVGLFGGTVALAASLLVWRSGLGSSEAPLVPPDAGAVEAAARRLIQGHELGDGSRDGYEAHMSALRATFGDPRFALGYRRLLRAAADWDSAAQATGRPDAGWTDAVLERHLQPTFDHLALDFGMVRELQNSSSLTRQLGDSGRNASMAELDALAARAKELASTTREHLPALGTLVDVTRPRSLAFRAGLSGLFDLDSRGALLAEVLRVQATAPDPAMRARMVLGGLYCLPGAFGLRAGDCGPRVTMLDALLELLRSPGADLAPATRVSLAGHALVTFHPFLSRCDPDPGGKVTALFEAAAEVLQRYSDGAPGLAATYLHWFSLNDSIILGIAAPSDPKRWGEVTLRLRAIRSQLAREGA